MIYFARWQPGQTIKTNSTVRIQDSCGHEDSPLKFVGRISSQGGNLIESHRNYTNTKTSTSVVGPACRLVSTSTGSIIYKCF